MRSLRCLFKTVNKFIEIKSPRNECSITISQASFEMKLIRPKNCNFESGHLLLPTFPIDPADPALPVSMRVLGLEAQSKHLLRIHNTDGMLTRVNSQL